MVHVSEFVNLCLRQTGDRYVYGAEVAPSNPDPNVFDCSELLEWAGARLGVSPRIPDGSWAQLAHCRAAGLGRTIDQGIRTYGALLFMGADGADHVAVSLGNGSTIEARGRAYGVGSWTALQRPWSAAALIPGLAYDGPAPTPEEEVMFGAYPVSCPAGTTTPVPLVPPFEGGVANKGYARVWLSLCCDAMGVGGAMTAVRVMVGREGAWRTWPGGAKPNDKGQIAFPNGRSVMALVKGDQVASITPEGKGVTALVEWESK